MMRRDEGSQGHAAEPANGRAQLRRPQQGYGACGLAGSPSGPAQLADQFVISILKRVVVYQHQQT